MTHKDFTHIQIKKETLKELTKLRNSIEKKNKQRLSIHRTINILINTFKDFSRLNTQLNKYKEKVHALENHIEQLELTNDVQAVTSEKEKDE
jgi:hypothetical protein